VIDFPMVQDLASLLWLVNLGCIDLNPWYARWDDVDRPDYLHFDLDPVPEATYENVVETANLVRRGLQGLGMAPLVKTTGSRGLHVYVAIVRGPTQKQVWGFAKRFAFDLARLRPDLVTSEYRIAKRPAGRVLVDYNQNAWGRTLASAYSPRPRPAATVSAPITWEELEAGARIEDFDLRNMPARVAAVGDLWAPLLAPASQRFDLAPLLRALR
jgi:bifunctional non-homologous end joining protein LigD